MDPVAAHYAIGNVHDRLLAAVAEAGIPLDRLTVDDLAPADEFHIGGRAATDALLEAASLPAGGHVLDVGSGLGGTARYLAAAHGHTVTGVDLIEEHVAVSRWLTGLLGLEDRVRFVRAGALHLPFLDEAFDAAIQLHVGMNVEDKGGLFAEIRRILRPGGRFAVYDVMGPPDADVELPVPWASAPEGSHLATPETYVARMEEAGLQVVHLRDRTRFAVELFARLRRRPGPPPPIGLQMVMGPAAGVKYENMARAVERGTMAPVEIVAQR